METPDAHGTLARPIGRIVSAEERAHKAPPHLAVWINMPANKAAIQTSWLSWLHCCSLGYTWKQHPASKATMMTGFRFLVVRQPSQ